MRRMYSLSDSSCLLRASKSAFLWTKAAQAASVTSETYFRFKKYSIDIFVSRHEQDKVCNIDYRSQKSSLPLWTPLIVVSDSVLMIWIKRPLVPSANLICGLLSPRSKSKLWMSEDKFHLEPIKGFRCKGINLLDVSESYSSVGIGVVCVFTSWRFFTKRLFGLLPWADEFGFNLGEAVSGRDDLGDVGRRGGVRLALTNPGGCDVLWFRMPRVSWSLPK